MLMHCRLVRIQREDNLFQPWEARLEAMMEPYPGVVSYKNKRDGLTKTQSISFQEEEEKNE